MMKIILNEKEIAENMLKAQTKFRNVNTTIDILVKYWNSKKKSKDYILEELDKFLNLTHKSYNKVKWANRISGTIDWHLKNDFDLISVSKVDITQSELDYIRGMDSIVIERLAFVMLVYAKILNQINPNNNNYVKNKMDEMFRCAKISGTMDKKYKYVNRIKEYGGIDRPLRVDGVSISVNFIDNNNSDIIICITDFREFVLEYLRWRGDRIGACQICGIKIQLNNNKMKYCNPCAKLQNIQKTLDKYNSKVF